MIKLNNTHMGLKKLQFLFELPTKLRSFIESQQYGHAVRLVLVVGRLSVNFPKSLLISLDVI